MKLLEQLFEQETLTKAEAKSLLTKITEGELNDAQIVAAIAPVSHLNLDEVSGLVLLCLLTLHSKRSPAPNGKGHDARQRHQPQKQAEVTYHSITAGSSQRGERDTCRLGQAAQGFIIDIVWVTGGE